MPNAALHIQPPLYISSNDAFAGCHRRTRAEELQNCSSSLPPSTFHAKSKPSHKLTERRAQRHGRARLCLRTRNAAQSGSAAQPRTGVPARRFTPPAATRLPGSFPGRLQQPPPARSRGRAAAGGHTSACAQLGSQHGAGKGTAAAAGTAGVRATLGGGIVPRRLKTPLPSPKAARASASARHARRGLFACLRGRELIKKS